MEYGKLQLSSVTTAVLMLLHNGGMPDTLHGFKKCPNAWERDHDTDISLSMFVLDFRGRTRRLPGPLECCRLLLRNKHSTYRLTEEQGEVLFRVAESLKHETSWSFQQQSQALLEEPTCHDELGERMDFQRSTKPCLGFLQASVFQLDVSMLSASVFFSPEASNSLVFLGLALAGQTLLDFHPTLP